jgi:hypothetical protein
MIPVFCLLVAIGGGTVLASGMLGIAAALFTDATVEVSHLDGGYTRSERIYNQGKMHERQIALLTSGIAVVSGILIIGFSALASLAIRTTNAVNDVGLSASVNS